MPDSVEQDLLRHSVSLDTIFPFRESFFDRTHLYCLCWMWESELCILVSLSELYREEIAKDLKGKTMQWVKLTKLCKIDRFNNIGVQDWV